MRCSLVLSAPVVDDAPNGVSRVGTTKTTKARKHEDSKSAKTRCEYPCYAFLRGFVFVFGDRGLCASAAQRGMVVLVFSKRRCRLDSRFFSMNRRPFRMSLSIDCNWARSSPER